MRVAIIGAGVMGCASSLALAARGVEVILLERAIPGAEASSAAGGILGAQIESHEPGPHVQKFVEARASYRGWSDELRDRTGIDIGLRASGVIQLATNADEHEAIAKTVAWQKEAGLRASLLTRADARALEPEIAEGVLSAAHFPDDAQVDPRALLRALVAAVGRSDIGLRTGVTVREIAIERNRCVGVRLDGETIWSDAVVVAAGAWSQLVPGLPLNLPRVIPVRGQMIQLEERPPRVRSIVYGAQTYVVPRGDGRVVCGSTIEHVGFRNEVTAGGVHRILSGVMANVPRLADAELVATWSNFRPKVDGDVPLVGKSPLDGLFLATGHYRNGILLAKTTSEAVADAVTAPASPLC